MVTVFFRTVQLREHCETRPVCLITSSLWVFNLTPFLSPLLGAPRGPDVTKSILYPSGTTVSPEVFTSAVDRSVTMHSLRRESLSRICCGFRIQPRVSG